MSELVHESTADPLKKDDKDVESLAHDIEGFCLSSSGATSSETVKKKESSKNDIQESPTGKSGSKENKDETPLAQKSAGKGKLLGVARKLDFESKSPLEKIRAKIKEYFEEEDSLQYSSDVIEKNINKDKRGSEWKFLLAKMLEERKSKGKELTLEDLKKPGIYYLKLHQDVPFPDPPNTTITCHYVGKSVNVYNRIGEHLRKDEDKIDQQLAKFPPKQYNWTVRVVMLKEIPVDEIKELHAIKGDEDQLINVLEKIGIMEMKSLYPNGYNIRLDMPRSMTYVDYEFTFKEN